MSIVPTERDFEGFSLVAQRLKDGSLVCLDPPDTSYCDAYSKPKGIPSRIGGCHELRPEVVASWNVPNRSLHDLVDGCSTPTTASRSRTCSTASRRSAASRAGHYADRISFTSIRPTTIDAAATRATAVGSLPASPDAASRPARSWAETGGSPGAPLPGSTAPAGSSRATKVEAASTTPSTLSPPRSSASRSCRRGFERCSKLPTSVPD